MEEQLISFETAKLAKEKGFDVPTLYGCNEQGELLEYFTYASYSPGEPEIRIDEFINKWEYQLPTQSLLAKWLREKHNIHLIAYKNINIDGYDWCYITTDGITNINSYKTYEEAYEIGLQEALKLIK